MVAGLIKRFKVPYEISCFRKVKFIDEMQCNEMQSMNERHEIKEIWGASETKLNFKLKLNFLSLRASFIPLT